MNASENDVRQQLLNMIGWDCSYQTPPERAYFYNGFETPPQGPEWGERVLKSRPHCGRFSLKNPQHLFFGGQTKDMWGRVLQGYDVARYKQVGYCLSLRIIMHINLRSLHVLVQKKCVMTTTEKCFLQICQIFRFST